jgi:hypothetical protein
MNWRTVLLVVIVGTSLGVLWSIFAEMYAW